MCDTVPEKKFATKAIIKTVDVTEIQTLDKSISQY